MEKSTTFLKQQNPISTQSFPFPPQISYRSNQLTNSLPPPSTEIITHLDLELFRVDQNSYHLTVNTVEGETYIGIATWWWNKAILTWLPTKKQVFLPKAAWFGLLRQEDRIASALAAVDPGINQNMNNFLICIIFLLLLN